MSIITVVPEDKIVIIDGECINFDFDAPANIHAVQWQDDKGHVEFKDPNKYPNLEITQADYNTYVKPYVDAFTKEKTRLKAEAERQAKEYQEWYDSEEQRFVRLREERNRKIAETDYLLAADYPIASDKLLAVRTYRQALRDITSLPGAPWTDDTVPWPEMPALK